MIKFPYNDYVDKVLEGSFLLFGVELRYSGDMERIDWENSTATITKRELKGMLIDAWLDGMKYRKNLVMERLK